MTIDAVLPAAHAFALGTEDDAAPRPLTWAAAASGHAALGLLALLVVAPMSAPPPRATPPALDVTIIEAPPEPVPDPSDEQGDASDAPDEPNLELAPAIGAPAVSPLTGPVAAPDAGASEAVDAIPESVRAAIQGYLRCASTAPPGAPAEEGEDPDRADCAGALERFAQLGGGADGLGPTTFIDPAALRDTGPAAMLKMMSDFAAAHAVDETMFDGRAGDGQAPATGWGMYAKGNPLTTDERIIEGLGVDVAAPHLGPPS